MRRVLLLLALAVLGAVSMGASPTVYTDLRVKNSFEFLEVTTLPSSCVYTPGVIRLVYMRPENVTYLCTQNNTWTSLGGGGGLSNPDAVNRIFNGNDSFNGTNTHSGTESFSNTVTMTGTVNASGAVSSTTSTTLGGSTTATGTFNASGATATLGTVNFSGSVTLPFAQELRVAKSGAAFSTVTSALASFSDNSASKRYLIIVDPGDYDENITAKSYVRIRGAAKGFRLRGTTGGAATVTVPSGITETTIEDAVLGGATAVQSTAVESSRTIFGLRNVTLGIIDGTESASGKTTQALLDSGAKHDYYLENVDFNSTQDGVNLKTDSSLYMTSGRMNLDDKGASTNLRGFTTSDTGAQMTVSGVQLAMTKSAPGAGGSGKSGGMAIEYNTTTNGGSRPSILTFLGMQVSGTVTGTPTANQLVCLTLATTLGAQQANSAIKLLNVDCDLDGGSSTWSMRGINTSTNDSDWGSVAVRWYGGSIRTRGGSGNFDMVRALNPSGSIVELVGVSHSGTYSGQGPTTATVPVKWTTAGNVTATSGTWDLSGVTTTLPTTLANDHTWSGIQTFNGTDNFFANRPNTERILDASTSHTCAILGDSLGADTPYGHAQNVGHAWGLTQLFAEDSDYTATTGSDLGPTTSTTSPSWSICGAAGSTWTQGTETLTLNTDSSSPCGTAYEAQGTYLPNALGAAGIYIDSAPTARYLLEFDADTTQLGGFGPVPLDGVNPEIPFIGTGANQTLDYLEVRARALGTGCGTDADIVAGGDLGSGPGQFAMPMRIGFRTYPNAHYSLVLDPTAWDFLSNDYSGGTKFGNQTCSVRLTFVFHNAATAAAKSVTITNISLKQLTKSTMFRSFAIPSQTLTGVVEDDYPWLKTHFITGKTRPADCLILFAGTNDYQGSLGSTASASTITSYFASLASLKASTATDNVIPIKVLVPGSRNNVDTGTPPWSNDNKLTKSEGWRQFIASERRYLRVKGWKWLDMGTMWRWDAGDQWIQATINTANLPGAGSSVEFPIFSARGDSMGTIRTVQIVSNTSTSGSNSSNRWCFDVVNHTNGVNLNSPTLCTDTGELTAYSPFGIPIQQTNPQFGPGQVLTLKITRTGTPTALTSAAMNVMTVEDDTPGAENPYMYDEYHPSSLGRQLINDRLWEFLTGRQVSGAWR